MNYKLKSQNYNPSLFKSLILHIVILVLISINLTELNHVEKHITKTMPLVKAVTVDANQVEHLVSQIKFEEQKNIEASKKALADLQAAKTARQLEEKKIKLMQQEHKKRQHEDLQKQVQIKKDLERIDKLKNEAQARLEQLQKQNSDFSKQLAKTKDQLLTEEKKKPLNL